jgi:hypothetical protein
MVDDLITQIETEAERRNLSPSTLCRLAVNDGKLIERLRDGKSLTLKTIDKLQTWLEANPATSAEEASHAA